MLSSVLNSDRAVQMNINIMRAFVRLVEHGGRTIADSVVRLSTALTRAIAASLSCLGYPIGP